MSNLNGTDVRYNDIYGLSYQQPFDPIRGLVQRSRSSLRDRLKRRKLDIEDIKTQRELEELQAGGKPPSESELRARRAEQRALEKELRAEEKRMAQARLDRGQIKHGFPKPGLLNKLGLGQTWERGIEELSPEQADPIARAVGDFRSARGKQIAQRAAQEAAAAAKAATEAAEQQGRFTAAKNRAEAAAFKQMGTDGWWRNETGAWVGPNGEPVPDEVYERAYNRELERQQQVKMVVGGKEKTLSKALEEQKAAAAEFAEEQAQVMRFMNEPAAPEPAAPAPAPAPAAEPPPTPEEIMEIQRLLNSPKVPEDIKQELRQHLLDAGSQ